MSEAAAAPKPKKSVALSGVAAGNTALCTVGRSGNDLHYRGYDILDFADEAEFDQFRKTITWEGHTDKIRAAYLCVAGEFDELSPIGIDGRWLPERHTL